MRPILASDRLEVRCEATLVGSAGRLGGIVASDPTLIRVGIRAVVVTLLVSDKGLLFRVQHSRSTVSVVSTI
jgi:hypothetical protein